MIYPVINEYLEYLKQVKRLAPNTVQAYTNDLERFDNFLTVNSLAPDDLGPKDVRRFLALLTEYKLDKRSINRIVSAIRGFFRYTQRFEIFERDPFDHVRNTTGALSLPQIFTEQEINSLMDMPGNNFKGMRDRVILELLYSTGCRAAELTSMNVLKLDLKERCIPVKGKGNKERYLFFGKKAGQALSLYLPVRKHYVSATDKDAANALIINQRGKRITTRGVAYILESYFHSLHVSRKAGPHTMRHTFATHLLDQGADIRVVQELLGHASVSSTQIYTHVGIERLKQVYTKAHPHSRAQTHKETSHE